MIVEQTGGDPIDLGTTETSPTISILDYSRRVTDDFGVTTVVKRGFSRRMSVRLTLPSDNVDSVQAQLANLRATSALWTADDRFAWLAVEGFLKDFEIDLAVPPTSYCRLTIEGVAETEVVADAGGDPAPLGQTSNLRVLQPNDGNPLVSSTVAENDYPEWSAGTSYAAGARVIKAATHRIYESVNAANLGNDPASSIDHWIDVGPTNRWAMFDQALGTVTSNAASIVVQIPAARAVALLDVVGATVRVQATGYDQTQAVSAGAILFPDLPAASGTITVTIAGAGTVSVGTLIAGTLMQLGQTESSPTAGITDYSRKDVDDFGEVTVVQRAWAKRMATRALIRADYIDRVANRIAALRGRPVLWIGDEAFDSLTVYGFFKEFSIEVGETVGKLSLNVEGLSKAAPLQPWGAISAQLTNESAVVSTAADGSGGVYAGAGGAFKLFAGTKDISTGNGVVYSVASQTAGLGLAIDPISGVFTITAPTVFTGQATFRATYNGETYDKVFSFAKAQAGALGAAGLNNATITLYKRAAGAPAVPSATTTYTFATGVLANINNGWTRAIPAANGQPLYATSASASAAAATDDIATGEWSAPVIMAQDGAGGAAGLNVATVFLYKRAAAAPAVPTTTSTFTFATGVLTGHDNGWTQYVPAGTTPLYVTTATASAATSTDMIATGEWAAPTVMAQNGSDGTSIDFRFKRSLSAPATPTGDDPAGWSNSPPTGTDTLWLSKGKKAIDGTLVGTWSVPQSITGLVPRGAYDAGATYYALNWVTYNGGSYAATQDGFSGQAPTGTAQSNAYWDVIAAPGAAGAPGTPPSAFTATINLTNSSGANLRTLADAAGYTGASNATITFNVPTGVVVRGLGGAPNGGIAIDTGTWPAGYTISLTLNVTGTVDGGGGKGGTSDAAGGNGGDAIYCRQNITIVVNAGGVVRAGGGGGGGGASVLAGPFSNRVTYCGGGGGGGFPNGAGGLGGDNFDSSGNVVGTAASPGAAGTTAGGGAGGNGGINTNDGGNGGGAGTVGEAGDKSALNDHLGAAGGAAGYAVRKNGNTVPVTNNGTMSGTAA